jgi:four helix bundle protein
VCAKLPDDEKYGLSSQLKRAVVSIASNIAEGFNRRTTPDKAHFYTMAQGSVAEVQSQLKIVVGVGHLSEAEVKQAINLSIRIHKMLTGLIKVTKLRVAK